MHTYLFTNQRPHRILSVALLVSMAAVGCGFERIQPLPAAAVPNFTLTDLEDIQNDGRLTINEQREAIRTAIGAPMTPEGDRIVDFLLNLNIP